MPNSPYTSQPAILMYLVFAVLWIVVLMQR